MKVAFLHGTETGNAEMLCEDMMAAVSSENECSIDSLYDVQASDFDADTVYILAVSTCGVGDLPSSVIPFFERLEKETPDLSHLRFVMFGLGDRGFGETFNMASQQVEAKLLELGATAVADRLIYDAAGAEFPEEIGVPWIKELLGNLKAAA